MRLSSVRTIFCGLKPMCTHGGTESTRLRNFLHSNVLDLANIHSINLEAPLSNGFVQEAHAWWQLHGTSDLERSTMREIVIGGHENLASMSVVNIPSYCWLSPQRRETKATYERMVHGRASFHWSDRWPSRNEGARKQCHRHPGA